MNEAAGILVVEDDAAIRTGLELNLTAEGYRVRAAATGEEALEAVAERPPSLIILDVMLPGLSGFEVLERMRTKGYAGGHRGFRSRP